MLAYLYLLLTFGACARVAVVVLCVCLSVCYRSSVCTSEQRVCLRLYLIWGFSKSVGTTTARSKAASDTSSWRNKPETSEIFARHWPTKQGQHTEFTHTQYLPRIMNNPSVPRVLHFSASAKPWEPSHALDFVPVVSWTVHVFHFV